MDSHTNYDRIKSQTEAYYKSLSSILCPYFGKEIVFNADGLYRLQFSARIERSRAEQILKFYLFKYVPEIIQRSGTIQEYRKTMGAVGKKKQNGEQEMKIIEYWGLVA
jgi:hypothetical protein